jgi:hypothetical protein
LHTRAFRVGKNGIRPPCRARFWPMDEPNENSHRGVETSAGKPVSDFVAGLSDEHRMLVILKAQLYGGTWEPMLDDLQNRLEGKPYIFKLVNRIKDDIERIEQMRKFEEQHNVDLAEYVELS